MFASKSILTVGLLWLAMVGVARAATNQICTHFAHIKPGAINKVTNGGLNWTALKLTGTTDKVVHDAKAFVGKHDLQLYTPASNTIGASVFVKLTKPFTPLDGTRVSLTVRRSSAARTFDIQLFCGKQNSVDAEMDPHWGLLFNSYQPVTRKDTFSRVSAAWRNGHNYTFVWTFHQKNTVVTYNLKVTDATSKRVVAYVADIHARPGGADDISEIHFYAAGGTNPDSTADAAEIFYIGQICVSPEATHRSGKR
jgi:hypothetical protein